MNTVLPSGLNPQFTVQEAAALSAVGQTAPKPAASPTTAPQIELAALDLVKQSAGATGKATSIDLVENPQTAQIRDMLARKDFDGIAQMVNQLGSHVDKLDLNLDEIKAIYSGFHDGCTNRYSAEEEQAISTLLNLSQININQKIQGLEEMVGFDAARSLISRSTDQQLKGLNEGVRAHLIDKMGLNSLMRAGTQVSRGSGVNYKLTPEEELAAKLLKSVSNDSERLGLLDKMSQFSRDDVTFGYINRLSADELANMSEATKKQLLKHLIDTSINLPMMSIDLNKLMNLDEALGMVSGNHAEAARRLYVAMKPETRSEQEVQDLRAKSDEFMKQITDLEQSLKADIQSGKIDQTKIDGYRSQLQSLQQTYPNQPEVQKKVAELLESLNGLQTGLAQASQLKHQGVGALSQTLEQLETAQATLKDSKLQLEQLNQSLAGSAKELNSSEAKLATQIQQLAAMRTQLIGLGDNFISQLDLLSALPPNQLRNKLPQMEQLLKQLQQSQIKLETMGSEQSQITQQVTAITESLSKGKLELEGSLSKVSQDYQKLQERKTLTQSLLTRYQDKLSQLETQYLSANQQLGDLSALPEVDRQKFQSDLTQIRQKLDQHQTQATEIKTGLSTINTAIAKLEAESAALTSQAAETQTQFTNLETQIVRLETLGDSASETREEINTALVQAKEQAMALINELKSGAGSIQKRDTNKSLKAAKDQLEAMKNKLTKEAAQTPENVQAELQEIDSLIAQIGLIQQDATSANQALSKLSSEINAGKKELEDSASKLGDSTQAVANAQAQTRKAQTQVQNVQQQLVKNTEQLAQYHLRVAALNTELNNLSSANKSSKDSYFDLFAQPTGTGQVGFDQMVNAKEQEMLSTLSQTDQKRAQIESELKSLKSTIDTIQSTMEIQDKSLATFESELKTQLETLQSLSSKVDETKADYQKKITDFNAKQLQFKDAITALSQKEPQSNLVKKAIARAQNDLDKVANVQKDATTLLESYSQFAIEALASEKLLATGIQNIQGARTSTQTVLEQIKPIAAEVNQEVSEMDQHTKVQNDLEIRIKSIHDQLKAQTINYADAEAQLKALDFDSGTAGLAYSDSRKEIEQIRDEIRNAKAEQQVANTTMADFKGHGFDIKVQAAKDKIAETNAKFEAYQTEFSKSRDVFLNLQKQLLSARSQIGVANKDYQAILGEMNQLLSSGKQLSPEDLTKLVGFEMELQVIEQNEVQNRTVAGQQIQTLNHLKQNLNHSITELKSVEQSLSKTRAELDVFKADLSRLKLSLEDNQPRLIRSRASLAEKLARLESKGNAITADDRKMIAELKELLKELDDTISTNSRQISELGDNIKQIDDTSATIDQTLNELAVLKLNLELLVSQVSEGLDKIEQFIDALDALKGMVLDLKSKFQSVQKQVTDMQKDSVFKTSTSSASTQSNGARTDQTTQVSDFSQKRDEIGRQSFTNRLTSQFSNMLTQRQRQSDQQLEEKHQASRQELQKNLEQQLQSLRQQESALSTQLKEQATLEAVTDYLVQQAHLGNSVTSGLNIV